MDAPGKNSCSNETRQNSAAFRGKKTSSAVKFRDSIPQQKPKFRGSTRNSADRGKLWGPSHNCGEVLSFRKCQHVLFLHYPVQLIVLSKPTTSRILQTKKSLADGRILDLYCYDNVEQLNFRNIWTSVCVSLRNQVYYCNCNNKFR